MKIPLLYSLHSGNLYGTERMALATAIGLGDEFETTFIAPAGPIHDEVARHGFASMTFETPLRYVRDIHPVFAGNSRVVCIGTRVLHTLAAEVWTRLYGTNCANIQVVHGGADERLSYARKRWLNRLGVQQVAVSKYVRERMLAHGADGRSVSVIENFLTAVPAQSTGIVPPQGIRKVAIVSRLDPIKRVDLLLDALDLDESLRAIEFEVFGEGSEAELLRSRASAKHPNVKFLGFHPDVAERMRTADLLLHLCPEEPFGLAILEGMAAGLPVLVPDSGGAGSLVEDGRNGFRFRANDASALARKLHELNRAPAVVMRNVVSEGFRSLRTRFSAEAGTAAYRKLILDCLS
jgi:glycosyltransferase involved in cell wall biosynthesis